MSANKLSNFMETISKKAKKIAILVSAYSKYQGASRVAEKQAKELVKNGCGVSIFTFKADMKAPSAARIEIVRPPIEFSSQKLEGIYRGTFPLNPFQARKSLKKLRSHDLVITHQGNWFPLAYLSKKLCGIKTIGYVHHLDATSNSMRERIYSLLMGTFFFYCLSKMDLIVSVSNYTKGKLKEVHNLDSLVVYNEIDNDRFSQNFSGKKIRERYSIEQEPVILFVGRIVPYKRVHLLIKIVNNIRKVIPDVKLMVVGKYYSEKYKRYLKRIGNDSIIFAHNVSDEELPYYYAACDVYATCSSVEGFDLPIAEAQASGKPVVAFDIGPHKEVISDRGALVEKNDLGEFTRKVISLLRNQ